MSAEVPIGMLLSVNCFILCMCLHPLASWAHKNDFISLTKPTNSLPQRTWCGTEGRTSYTQAWMQSLESKRVKAKLCPQGRNHFTFLTACLARAQWNASYHGNRGNRSTKCGDAVPCVINPHSNDV